MTKFFNAFHSPLGAHASFTLGCKGKKGGPGLELSEPACENVYIGMTCGDGGSLALPFFEGGENESARFDHENAGQDCSEARLRVFSDTAISRTFKTGTDTWEAEELTCSIYTPCVTAPNPAASSEFEQQLAYCPAVMLELKIDNTGCDFERTAFVGFSNDSSSENMHLPVMPEGYHGIADGHRIAMFTNTSGACSAQGFDTESILSEEHPENYRFGLGSTGLLLFKVPAKSVATFKVTVCFFRPGIVTSGEASSYWYTRLFDSIEDAGMFALQNFDYYRQRAGEVDAEFDAPHLNDAQRFQIAHAVRSYFGSTQFLDWNGRPFWVVNEGEYRMMNTFDLTVDQLFFEMKQNPWTVKNELDMFVERYSYTDTLHFPGGDNIYPGGISFTHDMGHKNHISRPQYSTYEKFGLTGCFSHMTHEQLVNWVLCAAVYVSGSGDTEWLNDNINVFEKCLESMVNRDHPEPDKRNGIMALDSSRTLDGAEITTYDSLDQSLGQARNNVYIAVKSWAAYLALAKYLNAERAATASEQADKAAGSITSFLNEDGYIPAIMGEDCDSRIIPAIEGLVFPYVLDMHEDLKENGKFAPLIKALKKHFETVLVKDTCLYPDNGWKLSSSADNSWLSKIYLCQFVARQVLGFKNDATGILADEAHQRWLLHPENVYMAWSDQMRSGVAQGSKYYPRGVTNILWLEEASS